MNVKAGHRHFTKRSAMRFLVHLKGDKNLGDSVSLDDPILSKREVSNLFHAAKKVERMVDDKVVNLANLPELKRGRPCKEKKVEATADVSIIPVVTEEAATPVTAVSA